MSIATRAKYIMILTMFNLLTYFAIQHAVGFTTFDLLTPLDELIPLVPEFIWLYNTLIPVILISAVVLIRTRKIFWSTCVAFIIATIVLDIFYIALPSFYPREDFVVSSISEWALELTRKIDGSNNTFPSGHVTLSWLLFWSIVHSKCMEGRTAIKTMYGVWALLISASTLTLKQHYIADVVSGFALAYGCWLAGEWFVERLEKQKSPQELEAVVLESSPQLTE